MGQLYAKSLAPQQTQAIDIDTKACKLSSSLKVRLIFMHHISKFQYSISSCLHK